MCPLKPNQDGFFFISGPVRKGMPELASKQGRLNGSIALHPNGWGARRWTHLDVPFWRQVPASDIAFFFIIFSANATPVVPCMDGGMHNIYEPHLMSLRSAYIALGFGWLADDTNEKTFVPKKGVVIKACIKFVNIMSSVFVQHTLRSDVDGLCTT